MVIVNKGRDFSSGIEALRVGTFCAKGTSVVCARSAQAANTTTTSAESIGFRRNGHRSLFEWLPVSDLLHGSVLLDDSRANSFDSSNRLII